MITNRLFIFTSLFLAFTLFSGCLETPVAAPPQIDENILQEYGWVQLGDITKESKEFNISGNKIKINTATITYADKSLEEDIMRQIGAYTNPEGGFTAQLTAMRIMLPAGIPLPSQIVLEIASKQVENMAAQMNIEDFHEIKTTQIPLKDGKTTEAKVYVGHITFGDNNFVPLRGIITAWSASGSTLLVAAIYPSDDFVLKVGTQKVIINVDGLAEYEKITKLLQNME
jgi:hypothetical protein